MRRLLCLICMTILCMTGYSQRYLTEIFSNNDISTTYNVQYGENFNFLTGSPTAFPLTMDVYAPNAGVDPLDVRPTIVFLHTGSFLPSVLNQTPTGSKSDSTVAEMCRQFARRGYVAVAAAYRYGWNPAAPDQDVRTGSLLQAVYRSIQDAKACVRYIYKDVLTAGNTFGIDTNAIIMGGQGSGGYLALAYATLDQVSEINLPKFLSNTNNAQYGFVIGQSYINQSLLGDFDGYGGTPTLNNPNNSVGYSSKIHFVFNLGGAIGDSVWMEAGDVPMVAFHVVGDPFAPYGDGIVIVPTTGQFVVNVSGSSTVIRLANQLGNNNCFNAAGFTDPYTVRANQVNNGWEGLFPLVTNPNQQAGPWEWFDSLALVTYAQAIGLPGSSGTTAYQNGLITNPDMSKAKALAYIDTIQNYVNPRIVFCLGLLTGINDNEIVAASLKAMPNPSADVINIVLDQPENKMTGIYLYDITGRKQLYVDGIDRNNYLLSRNGLDAGIYFAVVKTEKGEATLKLIFQ
jgi:hypothetical protein